MGVCHLCYVVEDKREGPVLWPGGIIPSPCSRESSLLVILMTKAIKNIELGALIPFKAKGPYASRAGVFPLVSRGNSRAQPLCLSLSHVAASDGTKPCSPGTVRVRGSQTGWLGGAG